MSASPASSIMALVSFKVLIIPSSDDCSEEIVFPGAALKFFNVL